MSLGTRSWKRLAAEVRASLLVDPQELRKSESVRNETAKRAAAIADMMGAYMSGYSVTTPTTTTATTATTNQGRAA